MGRALGINAVMTAVAETTYGTTPGTGFFKLGLVSQNLGEEQPLIEDDQLGLGRDGSDPTYDVITNDGDLTVPVNTRGIGFWLRQTFGVPATSGPAGGLYTHVFSSGASSLPSASIETGNPDVPTFSMNFGNVVNQIKIGMARSGNLNAALSFVGQGELDPTTSSSSGTSSLLTGPRFAQATGAITIDATTAINVTSANVGFTNGLDKAEVIRADGRIGGATPGAARGTGDITVLLDANSLLLKGKARSKTPVALTFGWQNGSASLVFALQRVFLPKPKSAISGPKGIVTTFNWQSSGASGAQLIVTLVNDVASYA